MQSDPPFHSGFNIIDTSTLAQTTGTSYFYQNVNTGSDYNVNTDTHHAGGAFGYQERLPANIELRTTSHNYGNDFSGSSFLQTQVSQPPSNIAFGVSEVSGSFYPNNQNAIQSKNRNVESAYDSNRNLPERIAVWDHQNQNIDSDAMFLGLSSLSTSRLAQNEQYTFGTIERATMPMIQSFMDCDNFESQGEDKTWMETVCPSQRILLTPGLNILTQSDDTTNPEIRERFSSSNPSFIYAEEKPQRSRLDQSWLDRPPAPILSPSQFRDHCQQHKPEYGKFMEELAGENVKSNLSPAMVRARSLGTLRTLSSIPSPLNRSRTSRVSTQNSPEPAFEPHLVRQRNVKDEFLIKKRQAGMSYKDIKSEGGYTEAESTLRGRFRTLTKPKSARVRKPEWSENDTNLLRQAVNQLAPRGKKGKIPWKKIAEYIVEHGGSYHFGNSTCRKRWDELESER